MDSEKIALAPEQERDEMWGKISDEEQLQDG
jgi:hypothetical protein